MRVAVICGGTSPERHVSLRSGARVADVLARAGHDPEVVDVGSDAARMLRDGNYDVAFIALHGRGGEDGSIQSILELIGLPYTGSRSGPSEAAFDKARAKRAFIAADVPTPPFLTLSETALEEFGAADALEEARESIGTPMVVKPARSGSALGTRFVQDVGDLPRALMTAMSYDRNVLVERHIRGRELAVTVVGDAESARALPAVEIVPRNADWFDYESRYTHGETEFTCPPVGLSDDARRHVEAVACAAYRALDCSGFGRVDLIVDENDMPWVLEVAPVPGLTDTSIVPLACQAAGFELAQLLETLLDDALQQAGE